jgi:hypothetical protein
MKVLSLVAVIIFLLAATAHAQVPTIDSVRIGIAKVSAPAVEVATVTVPISGVVCNLTPTTLPLVTVNPGQAEWTDPANPLRVCRANIAATIAALPATDYVATAKYLYSDPAVIGGLSLASNPFTRFDPLTLLNLRLVR